MTALFFCNYSASRVHGDSEQIQFSKIREESMANILVVEDDRNMRLLTEARLSGRYHVTSVCDGREALDVVRNGGVDLVVADIMMPVMNGYELLRTLREEGCDVPFLLLTAKETVEDKKMGFELGADDYITKPYSAEELIWRIDAILRRANISREKKIVCKGTVIDSEKHAVYTEHDYIEMPRKEFELLFRLMSYPEHIFSKDELMDKVWGYNSDSGEETVKTHISRIRNRLRNITDFRIITVKGLGYKADTDEESEKD